VASASLPIAPFTVVLGNTILGPLSITGGQTKFVLTLDILNLTSMDVLAELSTDGGTSWRHLVSETGVKVGTNPNTLQPVTTERIEATWTDWPGGLPAGQVRVTLTNSVAFASTGGSLTLS